MNSKCDCFVFAILLVISTALFSCKSTNEIFRTESPPPKPLMPYEVGIGKIHMPPIPVAKNRYPTLRTIKSQTFKLAILPAADRTGLVGTIRRTLADKLYTSLFGTQRFILMDNDQLEDFVDVPVTGEWVFDKDSVKVWRKNPRYVASTPELNEYRLQELRKVCDGILRMDITSVSNNERGSDGKIEIDCKISSSWSHENPIVILTASQTVRFQLQEDNSTLHVYSEDIDMLAQQIEEKFPRPDLGRGIKIISKNDNYISINAGQEKNIMVGMSGYVIKISQSEQGFRKPSYRAYFEVTEVFRGACTARLSVEKSQYNNEEEQKYIINTIRRDEPVMFK